MNDLRTLDCAVAEQVLGYIWATFDATFAARLHGPRFLLAPDDDNLGTVYALQPDLTAPLNETLFAWNDTVPPYSTDIAAAWQVVDALLARGWYVSVSARPGEPADCTFSQTFRHCISSGKTAPAAICRAALVVGTETLGDDDADPFDAAVEQEESHDTHA